MIFGVLLWYCQSILQQIHALSTYLVETKSSAWEDHYQRFDEETSLRSSTKDLPLYIFAALGLFSMLLSGVMYIIASDSYQGKDVSFLNVAINPFDVSFGAFVITTAIYWVVFFNFWFKRDPRKFRKRAIKHWQKVLDEQAEEDLMSVRELARLSEASFAAVWENTEDDVYNEP